MLAATPALRDLVPDVREALQALDEATKVDEIAATILLAIRSTQSLEARREAIRAALSSATAHPPPPETIGDQLDREREIVQSAHLELLREARVRDVRWPR